MTGSLIIDLLIAFVIGFIVKDFLPSYAKHKGKNLATLQDIKRITEKEEEVRTTFKEAIEELKHQQNKLMKNYELFTVKKHAIYPELYKLVVSSITTVKDLKDTKLTTNFYRRNTSDVLLFMEKNNFTEQDKEEVRQKWDKEKESCWSMLQLRTKTMRFDEAKTLLKEANNYFLLNRLFLSEEISSLAKDALNLASELLEDFTRHELDKEHDESELIRTLDTLQKELFTKMRDELLDEALSNSK